jgi:hypothetical protein
VKSSTRQITAKLSAEWCASISPVNHGSGDSREVPLKDKTIIGNSDSLFESIHTFPLFQAQHSRPLLSCQPSYTILNISFKDPAHFHVFLLDPLGCSRNSHSIGVKFCAFSLR